MGTRHLTFVKLDGEYKVAQYGQWDGYPEGQGVEVLEFVRKVQMKDKLDVFKSKVRGCRFITQAEIDSINSKVKSGEIADWTKKYPELWRDTGAKVLDMIYQSERGIVLKNGFEFVFDHIWCEYIWGIDLDSNVFGAYVGDDKAHDVKPVKTWVIGFAPSKDEFLSAFDETESED